MHICLSSGFVHAGTFSPPAALEHTEARRRPEEGIDGFRLRPISRIRTPSMLLLLENTELLRSLPVM